MKDDVIATRCKELGCAVLYRAYQDYMEALANGYINHKALIIDDIWFSITGIDKDYFMKIVKRRGVEKYGKRFRKN